MKKIYLLLLVCVALLAMPRPTQAQDLKSAVEKLGSLAKKASKKSNSSSATVTTDDEEATEIAAEETELNTIDDESEEIAESETTKTKSSSKKSTLTNIIGDVTGLNKIKEKKLHGTWTYKEPGVGFASDNLLAEAGGEVAATACREQLESAFNSLGITPENTSFTFNDDGSFVADIVGKSVKGTYTFDESAQEITLKVLVISLKGHTKGLSDGMSLMFESDKILTLLESICKLSGSKTLSAVASLSSQYDGVLVGFDLTK